MPRSVFSGALLLAALFLGRPFSARNRLRPDAPHNPHLPERPNPPRYLRGAAALARSIRVPAAGRKQPSARSRAKATLQDSPCQPTGSRRNARAAGQPSQHFGKNTRVPARFLQPGREVMSCKPNIPIFARFLDSAPPLPLTARQKFILAARNVSDPFNLLTIGAVSAFTVARDAHTADGPGFKGFAKNAGVSLSQDMTGEFFGTF